MRSFLVRKINNFTKTLSLRAEVPNTYGARLYTCIDQICVEVFEKTKRGTEMIDHSFERKFYGVWNRLC